MAVVIAFLIVVSILVGYPYYQTYIAPWYKPVLEVKGKTFNRKYFMKRLRIRSTGAERKQQMIFIQLIGEIQNEELIRMEAEKRGFIVTAEEIAAEVRIRVKEAATGEGDFAFLYDSMLRGLQLERTEYEEMVRSAIFKKKLAESFLSEIPEETKQVFVKVIEAATAKKAEEIRMKLAKGEEFSKLAKKESIDLKTSKMGGDLGWIPKGVWKLKATGLVHARGILTKTAEEAKLIRKELLKGKTFSQLARTYSLDDASRDGGGYLGWVSTEYKKGKQFAAESYHLEPGQISRPIDTQEGFWIIQLIEKSPRGDVFDDYVFEMPVGKVSPPLDTRKGFILYQVIEKKERWPLAAEYRQALARAKMAKWLRDTAQKGSDENWIKVDWGSNALNWTINNLN